MINEPTKIVCNERRFFPNANSRHHYQKKKCVLGSKIRAIYCGMGRILSNHSRAS